MQLQEILDLVQGAKLNLLEVGAGHFSILCLDLSIWLSNIRLGWADLNFSRPGSVGYHPHTILPAEFPL
jgi:hypothetical protein